MLSTSQQYKKALINNGVKSLLDEITKWMEIHTSKLEERYKYVLCHYDFSGSNVLVDESSSNVSVLDFDNWKVSIPEEDFPKLLHWTIIDLDTKKRTPSPKLIEDFIRGYRNEGGSIDEQLLQIKEAEWLIRVYAHSLLREKTNRKEYEQSSFPSSSYYEQAIFSLLHNR
jgi:aminoglycoside phosphotransferase (APT) family kinase protein